MQSGRPYVLTIAGFDPSCGAGLSADLKTFEQLRVYGLALCSGITLQSEDEFVSAEWRKIEDLKKETEFLLEKYNIKAVKFGIVPSLQWISELSSLIKEKNKETKIVVDPVWKSSTGFKFADLNNKSVLKSVLSKIDLLTPNTHELNQSGLDENDLSNLSSAVLVKGGHDDENPGTDHLWINGTKNELKPTAPMIYPKHGSGCVLSAAIAANLALDKDLISACTDAKAYIEKFLTSNKSLLGYHAA